MSNENKMNRVPKLTELMGQEDMLALRSLDDVHPHLPARIGGLTVKSAFSEKGEEEIRQLLKNRTSLVRFVSATPQMGAIGMRYSPSAVAEYVQKKVESRQASDPLDEVFLEFEGIDPDTLEIPFGKEGKGHTAPAHLLESAITKGPEGDEHKKGPAPRKADLYDEACDMLAADMKAAGISNLKFSHAVMCTEDSEGKGIPFAGLKDRSAGYNAVKDPSKKPRKGNHIQAALKRLRNICVPGSRSLLMYPGITYKRFDRGLPLSYFSENGKLGDFNLVARDRAIIAQSFSHQISEALAMRPCSIAIQKSEFPSIALRTPYHTAFRLKELDDFTHSGVADFQGGKQYTRFLMGLDSSEWDNISVIPQTWYGFLRVMLQLYGPTQQFGVIYSDEFVVFDRNTERALEALSPGTRTVMDCTVRISNTDGTVYEEVRSYEAEMFKVDTESYFRRVFAAASANDIIVGDVQVTGFKHVLTTRDHGKVLVGWGQRSGNWSTYLGNGIMNLIDDYYDSLGAKDPEVRAQFKALYGYDLPNKYEVVGSLVAGDDKVVCVEIDPETAALIDDPDSDYPDARTLAADLMDMKGMKVNAKKQEGSGRMGPGFAGFAQMLVTKGKVYTRLMDILTKFFWRESDEATGIDPATGQDYRHLIGDLGNQARISNFAGSFGRDPHPWMDLGLGILQDLDVPEKGMTNRLLPPADSEEREILTRLFNARLARRGQAPAGAAEVYGLWDTPGPVFLEERYESDQSKLKGPWNPIVKGAPPKDARPQWRKTI